MGREYSRHELETIVRIRRRELTVKVAQLKRQAREVARQLEEAEYELEQLDLAERLLE